MSVALTTTGVDDDTDHEAFSLVLMPRRFSGAVEITIGLITLTSG
jgi:hypothetical protein